jgi:orotidine-5'-phosphate decarboxylase
LQRQKEHEVVSEPFHFGDALVTEVRAKKSILVVGLDPQFEYMPPSLAEEMQRAFGSTTEAICRMFHAFNTEIIDAVAGVAVAVKPQIAFYERYGVWGMWAYEQTIKYAEKHGLLVIGDTKRCDGGDTAGAYANGHIGEVPFWGETPNPREPRYGPSTIRVHATTVVPYIGDNCLSRFVKLVREHGSGIFIVDKTSFVPNSSVEELDTVGGVKVWQSVASMIKHWGVGTEGALGYRSVGAVLGATKPDDAEWLRGELPDSWFLVPGYGAQGAGPKDAVLSANPDGLGCIVNSSRGITYPYMDFKNKRYVSNPNDYKTAAFRAAESARETLNNALKCADKYNF